MTTEDKVQEIVRRNPEVGLDNKLLLMKFWEQEGLKLSPQQQVAFYNATSAESIIKAKKKLI